jgi:Sensors of blue-light using FAD
LTSARHFNRRDNITGSLICREDIFLQLLEGPPEAVDAAYARIARDGRPIRVVKLFTSAIAARTFPGWDMRHDPARSWIWTPKAVEAGAVRKASVPELLAVFARIAAEPGEGAAALL